MSFSHEKARFEWRKCIFILSLPPLKLSIWIMGGAFRIMSTIEIVETKEELI